ncbi:MULTISPECIES: hypothetical protein [Xanthomonas]|uniref:hypothetical protein n=1 Tax=Xanthomonas TaxID=338 RepID=UPI0011AF1912|nr:MULTISPECIES: hypothetical protein [Xanthomonas]UTS71814.1 hypothetical protein NMB96_14910 [Xanthomonas hortorum]
MCDDVGEILRGLGIGLASTADGSWTISLPPDGKERCFPNFEDVGIWLASWTATEYSEYLAIQHFRGEVEGADDAFLDEIDHWLKSNVLTDRIKALRAVVDSIVLSHDDGFFPTPALIVLVLRERVGHPYYSLGVRMLMSLEEEREKRRLAGV